ncbi:MAG: PAS domain S-box protein, partial [Acidobacteria bacterium]|nr:PAS domain S-box protein [Acidobacteriota bacterium]
MKALQPRPRRKAVRPDGNGVVLPPSVDAARTQQELEERTLYLDALIRNNPLAVVVLDPEHRVRTCNPAFERLFGYREQEIVGANLDEFIAPRDRPVEAGEFTQRILAGESVHASTRRRRKDGSEVAVELFGVPLQIGGKLVGVIGLYQDITDRIRAEEACVRFLVREQEARAKAESAEQRFRDLVQDLHAIVWEADADTLLFTFVSQRAEHILGYSVQQWLTEPDFWARHMHPDDREWALHLLRQAIAEGRDHEFEYRMVAADGRVVWLWDKVRVLCGADGGRTQLRGVMVDITEHMQAEQALLQSQTRLKLLNNISTGATAGRSVDDIIARALREIGSHFKEFRVAYATLNDQGRMTVVRSHQPSGIPATAGVQIDLSEAPDYLSALRLGEPIVVRDVFDDARLAPVAEAFTAHAARALLEFPLRDSGLVSAVLCFTAPAPHQWTENEMATLREVADYLSLAVKNARAEQALRDSEARYRSMVEGAPYGIYRSTPDGRLLDVNSAMVEMLGYPSAAELLRADLATDVYRDPEVRARLVEQYGDQPAFQSVEVQWKRKDGTPLTVVVSGRPVRDANGQLVCFEGMAENVSERRVLEEQLRQSQKIEAVGRLAGGIAHDFNNLLMLIKGYCELLLDHIGRDPNLRRYGEEIQRAADRATSLTQQLLAFSRKQVLEPKVLDLNHVVADMEKMLQRLLGEDVELAIHLATGLGHTKADPNQLEQVIMNLAVNARDAMPHGGKLSLETDNVELDTIYAHAHAGARPGSYVMLAVSDTGEGMTPEVKARIFEPFFTTKEKGKGTGLGLSTVYGIVKQSEGYIWVYSEPGRGDPIDRPHVEPVARPDRLPPVRHAERRPVDGGLDVVHRDRVSRQDRLHVSLADEPLETGPGPGVDQRRSHHPQNVAAPAPLLLQSA